MARALANTCSQYGKKVAFFMRKGADILVRLVELSNIISLTRF